MKRLLTYLMAIMLFPQIVSAVILVNKPKKSFSLSQTCVVTHNRHKTPSCTAPYIWVAYNAHKQSKVQVLSRNVRALKLTEKVRYLANGSPARKKNIRLAQAE